MTARRQARVNHSVAYASFNGVPRCLAVGRWIEVWLPPDVRADPLDITTIGTVRRRFSAVRTWWLAEHGIDDKSSWAVVPSGKAWSSDYLADQGRTERVADRLAAVGCALTDLRAIAAEAQRLYGAASRNVRHLRPSTQKEGTW